MEQKVLEHQILEYCPKTELTFLSKGNVVAIEIGDIVRISKNGSSTMIWTANTCYPTLLSLKELLRDLPVNDFFRIHRSHIISLRFMSGVKRNSIRVGECFLPVTQYYKLQLLEVLKSLINYQIYFLSSHD
jgi:DNA-binding LytR/AlgR family response regulator